MGDTCAFSNRHVRKPINCGIFSMVRSCHCPHLIPLYYPKSYIVRFKPFLTFVISGKCGDNSLVTTFKITSSFLIKTGYYQRYSDFLKIRDFPVFWDRRFLQIACLKQVLKKLLANDKLPASSTLKSITIFFPLFLAMTLAFGQDLVSALQVEYTVAGLQYGGSLMYEAKSKLGLGFFYQAPIGSLEDAHIKDQFYGVITQIPLAKSEKILFAANLRAGLVNDQFLVVVPGLETNINISKRIGIAFGMSLRMNYPSVSTKITLKLF